MKYNVNELLEKKKDLEAQIKEKISVNSDDVKFIEDKIIDHTNDKNTRTIVPRAKVSLIEFTRTYFGIADELANVKTAIQQYNASKVAAMLQERDAIRTKIGYLKSIKIVLPKEAGYGRNINRQDKDGVTLETFERRTEPMFPKEEVEKQINQFAAQERKLNTAIQKLNLEAEVEVQ